MSLILEALKKSEAERRLGHAPGLGTPLMHAPKRSGSTLWITLALACLAAGFGAAYLLQRGDDPAAAPEPVPSSPAVPQTVPVESPPVVHAPVTTTRASVSSAAPGVATPKAKPSSGPSPARPVAVAPSELKPELPRDPIFESIEREAMAMVAPAEPAPPAAPAPAAQQQASPAFATMPNIDQLDSGTRGDLPPLRLSMLVYNDRPESRFVRLDGQRLVEGTSITPSLRLVEIRRDGVVLDADGRHFFLPRP